MKIMTIRQLAEEFGMTTAAVKDVLELPYAQDGDAVSDWGHNALLEHQANAGME